MFVIQVVESVDPWQWLTIGMVVAIADVAIGSTYLLFLGVALACSAVWSWLGLSGELQLALLAVTTVASTLGARRFVGHSASSLHEQRVEDLAHARVKILWVDPDDGTRGRGAVEGHGEWLVMSDKGELSVSATYRVVEKRGQRCLVAPLSEQSSIKSRIGNDHD